MMANSDLASNFEDNVHGEEGGAWSTQTRKKRYRRSTGGTFSETTSKETVCNINKDAFKGSPITKALTCMKIYLYKQKWQICQEN